jgi:predicted heme/steroid binding protein
MPLRRFTALELSQYNGRRGVPAYIACQGKVYDVSKSFLWKQGRHQVTHLAGADLTAELNDAPHGYALLESFPLIGVMADIDI